MHETMSSFFDNQVKTVYGCKVLCVVHLLSTAEEASYTQVGK